MTTSKAFYRSSAALFLLLNLLFCNLVASQTIPTIPTIPTLTPTVPSASSGGSCPRDALKLGVCANVLTELLGVTVGSPPTEPCCPLILGLLNLEVATCLCTAIKANLLGINIVNIPVALSLLVNYCGAKLPSGFQCA